LPDSGDPDPGDSQPEDSQPEDSQPEDPRDAGSSSLTYAASGVDIDAAEAAVDAIRDLVASTAGVPGVIGSIGGFGGLFELPTGYRRPVLVSSTDGVGTKMAVAMNVGRFDTVGIDLVAMCVDDLVCCGARPLLFLDYQLLGKVDPHQVHELMVGIAEGCRIAGCAIVGGELAEHPGLLEPGELDVAGFAVGIVERDSIVDGPSRARPGDLLIGLASPGLRSNGYSLARAALLSQGRRELGAPAWEGSASSLADELLRPSVIYTPAILELLSPRSGVEVHAIAHVTGGGIAGNLRRVLPTDVDAVVDRSTWSRPRIFDEIQRSGRIEDSEMERVFNLGLGMVVAVAPASAESALRVLADADRPATVVGELVGGHRRVRLAGTAQLQR
jgi:phosphoribosylformylglycinamidine cyclo-ligase